MDCNEVKDKMSEYIDYNLDETEKEQFERHMQRCESCRKEFEDLEKIILRLKNISYLEPPSYLRENIMQFIKKENDVKFRGNKIIKFIKPYSYVAGIFIVLLGGVYLLNYMDYNSAKNDEYDVEVNSIKIADVKKSGITTSFTEDDIELDINFDDSSGYGEVFSLDAYSPIGTENYWFMDNDYNNYYSYLDEFLHYERYFDEDEENINLFQYDIVLQDDEYCKISYQNTSDEDVKIYIENSSYETVFKDYIVFSNKSCEIEFYLPENAEEYDIYTINIENLDCNSLLGKLNVDIISK